MKQKEAPARTGTDLRAVVYVRARPANKRQRDEILDALHECFEDELISDLQVRIWPKSISLIHKPGSSAVVSELKRIKEWAEQNGVSLQPALETEEVHSSITGEHDRILRLPSVCIVLQQADEPIGVFPCTDGERTVTVSRVVDALRTGRIADLPVSVTVPEEGT